MIVANGGRSMKGYVRGTKARRHGSTKWVQGGKQAEVRTTCASFPFPSLRAFAPPCLRALGFLILLLSISAAPLGTIETRHYVVHSDLPSDLTRDLAVRLDAMYDEYARRLVAFSSAATPERFNVYVFSNRKEYAKLTGNRFPNTGGIFISSQNLLAGFIEGQGRDALRRTLQHEAFHQFAYTMISPNLPVWLNEGLAQVFEEGIFTGKDFVLGQVPPRRIRQLQSDIAEGRFIQFKQMLSMDDAAWAQNLNDRAIATAQYNQAWAMVHFLIYALDDQGQPRYRDRLLSLLTRIHNRQDPQAAFEQCFGENIAGFENRFRENVASITATHAATYIEHQDVLADMLVAMRKDGKEFDTLPEFKKQVEKGQYRIEYRKGQLTWNTEKDPSIYFRDLQGQSLATSRMYFQHRAGAPCPDIVCRPTDEAQLRTIFSYNDGEVEHETVVEPVEAR